MKKTNKTKMNSKALEKLEKLKQKMPGLLVMSLLILTNCNHVGCSTFHQIHKTEEDKAALKASKVSRQFAKDVEDFRQTYKKNCE
jgi:hypothetical protein